MKGPMDAGGLGPISEERLAEARTELDALKEKTGWKEPVRSHMDDKCTKWRFGGPPDYTLANLAYLKGKTRDHKEGSLETVVENLVKTWEMERSHKLDCKQHMSVDQERFHLSSNHGPKFNNEEANKVGNYNVLLANADKNLYNMQRMSWQDSHDLFHHSFAAFPWEILEVYTGPPVVTFSWRHWGYFTGSFKENNGKGELIEVPGYGIAEVNDKLQLCDCEIFFDKNTFMEVLEGKKPASALNVKENSVSLYEKMFGKEDKKGFTMAQTYMKGPMDPASLGPISAERLESAKAELGIIMTKTGWKEPERSHMRKKDIKWRFGGPPDYTLANLEYMKGKTYHHEEGSLEAVVENLVKTWEMERSHKLDCKQHMCVDQEGFRLSANNGTKYNNVEANKIGNYNVLLETADKKLYDMAHMSWQDSHDLFHHSFPAFPWEVQHVFTGPPVVAFTWRHWGRFTGSFKGNKGEGQLVEVKGFGIATVNESL